MRKPTGGSGVGSTVPPRQDGSWQRIDQGLPHSAFGAPLLASWRNVPGKPLEMYALAGPAEARQLYHSEDGGSGWQPVEVAPGESPAPVLAVVAGSADGPSAIVIATGSRRLQRSLDGGATWAPGGPWPQESADGNPVGPGAEDLVDELLVQAHTPEHILALSKHGELWVSDNGGLSWHGAGPVDEPVTAAAWAGDDAQWAAAAREGEPMLFFRGDKADAWEARGLPGEGVSLAAEPGIRDSVYAAVRGGQVYHTPDRGDTWAHLGAPRAQHVTSLAVQPGTRSTLYATTEDGVWARPVTPATPTATPTSTVTALPSAVPAAPATAAPTSARPSAQPTAPAKATAAPSATASPTATVRATASPTFTATASPTATLPAATPTRRATVTSRPPTETPPAAPPTAPVQTQPTAPPQAGPTEVLPPTSAPTSGPAPTREDR